eukprot:9443398-Pyramimonas_sp.AAC.1
MVRTCRPSPRTRIRVGTTASATNSDLRGSSASGARMGGRAAHERNQLGVLEGSACSGQTLHHALFQTSNMARLA